MERKTKEFTHTAILTIAIYFAASVLNNYFAMRYKEVTRAKNRSNVNPPENALELWLKPAQR